jgi:phage shock protein A
MKLLDRLSTLVKADAHGMVDSLEDRRLVLKQCLREAELDLDAKRARREALAEEARALSDERHRIEEECRVLDADVELALDGGEEDLARFAARRLLERRDHAARLAGRLEEVSRESAELAERVRAQETELASLKSRVRTAMERCSAPDEAVRGPAVAEEEVDLELLRRRRARQGGE